MHAQSLVSFMAVNAHACRVYDPTGRCRDQYGAMGPSDWKMLEDERTRAILPKQVQTTESETPQGLCEVKGEDENGSWCAIDFGGSGTKWAVRSPQSKEWDKWGKWEGVDHHTLWSDPLQVGPRILAKLDEAGVKNISQLGFSVSGIVDPQGQKIVQSDHMNHMNKSCESSFWGFDLGGQCQSLCGASVGVMNDGVASALGATRGFGRQVQLPAIVLTLGSGPAYAIVDGCGLGPPTTLTSKELAWSDTTIVVNDYGERQIAQAALFGRVLQNMEVGARSCRVGHALSVLIARYATDYKSLPASVVIAGGSSVGLNHDDILGNCLPVPDEVLAKCSPGAAQPVVVPVTQSYKEQSSYHLEGARLCADPMMKVEIKSE